MSDSDIVQDFLVESYENLDRLDRELVGLEKNPQDRDALASVFRTIHTIKGTCGFLGFNQLEKVAHVGENLLTRLRDGQLTLNRELTTALLEMVDAVRQMLSSIEATGGEGKRDDTRLIATLTRLQQLPEAQAVSRAAPLPATPEGAASPASIGDILMQTTGVTSAEIQLATEKQKEGDPRRLGEILVEQGAVRPGDIVDALRIQQSSRARTGASESTIRVDTVLLDKVMTLVGELVLARNQVLQFASPMKDTGFLAASHRLNLITTELQAGIMKTRMQPIRNIWGQFPRTVRDVALGCGKEVGIEMEGKETELDKTIIEAIKDPLTHLVRNSVDHGIELPEDRVKAGKDRAGRLILRAFHEGGQVNIEISDDGAGLNVERIRKKAVERGVITAEQAARMPEREIFNLIFLPGFSTAEKVTNVSGRGVGMDVVKTNVEKIGGTVDVQSTLGPGHDGSGKDSLDPGHHSGAGCHLRRRSLCHSPGELARTGAAEGRPSQQGHRIGSWRAGLPVARTSPASGVSQPGTEAGCAIRVPLRKATARSTSWSCKPMSGNSGWSWIRSTTPKKSW